MRIAMFMNGSFPPHPRVENEAKSLLDAGHEVHLFALSYDRKGLRQENVDGIQLHRFQAGKLVYKLSALAHNLPFYRWLIQGAVRRYIQEVKPDALHVHNILLAEAVKVANQSFRLPFVLDIHENLASIMAYYPHKQKFPGKQLIRLGEWQKAEGRLAHYADAVVVVTPEAASWMQKTHGLEKEKLLIVPNTIHPELFHAEANEALNKRFASRFVLLYVGDVGLRRGTATAIEALPYLKEEIPNIQLVLVGESRDRKILEEQVKALGLEEKVSFEGWQSFKLFPAYVEEADVCLSPLQRNLHHDTTYANKLFQYMAMGKPLLVSDSTAQAVLVSQLQSGLVFEAGNALSLAQKIRELYRSPEKAKAMGESGKKAVKEEWNWPKTSQPLLNYYASSIASVEDERKP